MVINKKIHKGANYFAGEWGHNPLPYYGILDDETVNLNKGTIMPGKTTISLNGNVGEKSVLFMQVVYGYNCKNFN